MSKVDVCCKLVPGTIKFRPCGKPAKMTHEGKHYCGIHDPIRRAAKRAEASREAELRVAWRAELTAQWRLDRAAPKMLATLKDLRVAIEKIQPWSTGVIPIIIKEIDNVIKEAEGK